MVETLVFRIDACKNYVMTGTSTQTARLAQPKRGSVITIRYAECATCGTELISEPSVDGWVHRESYEAACEPTEAEAQPTCRTCGQALEWDVYARTWRHVEQQHDKQCGTTYLPSGRA